MRWWHYNIDDYIIVYSKHNKIKIFFTPVLHWFDIEASIDDFPFSNICQTMSNQCTRTCS